MNGFTELDTMIIGYARVSTPKQKFNLQVDALKAYGCEKIFKEKVSGNGKSRHEQNRMLEILRSGDTLVVWKLDRLARSLRQLIQIVEDLNNRSINFVSLQDQINTSSPSGRLIFHVFAALADFERETIRERTNAGLASARARGRKGGRPKGLSESARKKAIIAKELYNNANIPVNELARTLEISKTTLYKYLRIHE